jgi:imidazoleglycerol-phosphate dehydratase
MSSDLIVHFFEAFAINAKMTVHSKFLSGRNDHHKAEALFKALGVAFGMAVQVDPRRRGSIPSEKGVI